MGRPGEHFNFDQYFNAESTIARHGFPLTEPLIVTSLHVDGFTVNAMAGTVHLAGWQTVEPLSEGSGERRIVVRFAMSEFEARAFKCALGGALHEGY